MTTDIERRHHKVELRQQEGEKTRISGYGAIFDGFSEDLGGFIERIDSTAFEGRLDDDVRALFNHDESYVLGRTKSGTLSLSVDEKGLFYDVLPPDSQTIRDLVLEPMARGDINQSSFGFTVADDDWSIAEDQVVRTITKFKRLYDVSPVTFPAYPGASSNVSQRTLKRFEETLKSKSAKNLSSLDALQKQIDLLKILNK